MDWIELNLGDGMGCFVHSVSPFLVLVRSSTLLVLSLLGRICGDRYWFLGTSPGNRRWRRGGSYAE